MCPKNFDVKRSSAASLMKSIVAGDSPSFSSFDINVNLQKLTSKFLLLLMWSLLVKRRRHSNRFPMLPCQTLLLFSVSISGSVFTF